MNFAIEHFLAFDVSLQHLGVDAERRAGENDEIGVLSLLQRADALVEMQHLRAVKGQRLEGVIFGQAAAHGDGAGTQKEARLGDGIVGVDRHLDAGLGQDHRVLFK